tara:strand:+ start:599 stop:1354 length:756 start_codon:yes stop_codon:yes gene_type:complete
MINGSNNTETILDTNTDIHITGNVCSDINCIDELINHIKEKKRKLNLYRKILELKYNRYKKCHNAWSISTILLSTCLTLIESCKLIFIDKDDKINREIYDLSPIFIGSIITCTSSILKFKKYQEKMELSSNTIEKCVSMIAKIKNKLEVYELHKTGCNNLILKTLIENYNDEILKEYFLIYQESQKYIKNTDYDKYARIINNSELHKHIIEQERLRFYKKYAEYDKKQNMDIDQKIIEINKCYKYKLCCCC